MEILEKQKPAERPSLEEVPRLDIVRENKRTRARDVILLTRLLIDALGKEEAGKQIKKARYEQAYQQGRQLAEKLGNPQELDDYIEHIWINQKMPWWVDPGVFLYRTKTKAVIRTSYKCYLFEGFRNQLTDDPELQKFLGDNYCVRDSGVAKGFLPKMKCTQTKSFFWGDPYCEWEFEV